MRNGNHAGIVKAGGDALVSVRWQLYDSAEGSSGQNTDAWLASCCQIHSVARPGTGSVDTVNAGREAGNEGGRYQMYSCSRPFYIG
jgi:hypothetical protein